MNKIELLSPVGEWDSLVAAVQNGANAVYFGANEFNARMNSKNFDREELKKAIEYAKLRNVKTNLTLNILIKNNEFESAMNLVKYAYEAGIDAIIVQDLGLAKEITNKYPDLDVHSSTQMTIYNIDGVKKAKELGVKRCVLARELSINEIKEICRNADIEIEVFIHGALCICYSGQCLMSSIIGGRSGNRGKCAGTCRLPYTLLKDKQTLDSGYLLSSKDVYTIDIIPELIEAGIKSFKIEGRMKSPEYVGLVTSIYRKYIDLYYSGKPYVVDKTDREKLMQIFNRGGFSTGYLKGKLGKEMMYKYKPNHIGVYIGKVVNYNDNKGHVKIKLEKELDLGDSIGIKDSSCKISELMIGNNNIKNARVGQTVTVGRINGKILLGDKVYKTVSNSLNKEIEQVTNKENIKREIECKIILKEGSPINLYIRDTTSGVSVQKIGVTPIKAENIGTTRERVKEQLSKLRNTVFKISKIDIDIDDKIITSISNINEIRRDGIQELEEKIKQTFKRKSQNIDTQVYKNENKFTADSSVSFTHEPEVTICLNQINESLNYENLKKVDNIYIPLRFFIDSNFKKQIEILTSKYNVYLLMPTISKGNYEKINIQEVLNNNIKGIVVSNISQVDRFKGYNLIANYTFNIMNNYTINELQQMGFYKYIVSPETDKDTIIGLNNELKKEVMVYGKTLLMTTEYCVIGTFKDCIGNCKKGEYKLKDRMGLEFPILTDRVNCNNLIYNSKTLSIEWKNLNVDSIRLDILNENIEEINEIVKIHKLGNRLEGKDYTNGNLNRKI